MGGHAYKVVNFSRSLPDTLNSGTLSFTLQKDGDMQNPLVLVGDIDLKTPKPDTIKENDVDMIDANIHSDFYVEYSGFRNLKISLSLLVDFKFTEVGVNNKFPFFGDTGLSHTVPMP